MAAFVSYDMGTSNTTAMTYTYSTNNYGYVSPKKPKKKKTNQDWLDGELRRMCVKLH